MDNKTYIAKENTWFKQGTECKLLEDYQETGGLYSGIYIVGKNEGYDTFWHNKGHKEGDEVEMNEVCSHDEFNVLYDNKETKPQLCDATLRYLLKDFEKRLETLEERKQTPITLGRINEIQSLIVHIQKMVLT